MTEFKKFKVSKFFDIQKVRGVNKSGLTKPTKEHTYDYITRTSKNNGIEEITGLVTNRELNEPGTYSLGLLQMTFFLRDRPWYGGQFVRKIVPKVELNRGQMLYFLGVLQALSPMLKDILVRNVDKTFLNTDIELPVTPSGDPDFAYMTRYIQDLEAQRIQDLEAQRIQDLDAYLKVSGLDSTTLTDQEKAALTKKVEWKEYSLNELFDIHPSAKKLNANSVKFNGNRPYVARGTSTNGIRGYIDNDPSYLNPANTISFGQDTATIYYQDQPYFTGDKIQIFELRDQYPKLNAKIAQYMIACMNAVFQYYTWGQQSFAVKKLRQTKIALPVTSTGAIDFAYMQDYITALEKLNIKDVVAYKDKVIATTKQIVSQQS